MIQKIKTIEGTIEMNLKVMVCVIVPFFMLIPGVRSEMVSSVPISISAKNFARHEVLKVPERRSRKRLFGRVL